MSVDVAANGLIRRFIKYSIGVERQMRLTVLESLGIAQVEGANAEMTRSGQRWMGGTQLAANAIAPDTSIPTTTAKIALVNKNPAGGKALHIDHIAFWLASGTAAAGATLAVALSQAVIASPPTSQATGWTVQSASGSTAKTSLAVWQASATLPVRATDGANPFFCPILSNLQVAAANFGQGNGWARLQSGIIVPPGYGLGFSVLSGAGTTPLYGIGVLFDETDTDLE